MYLLAAAILIIGLFVLPAFSQENKQPDAKDAQSSTQTPAQTPAPVPASTPSPAPIAPPALTPPPAATNVPMTIPPEEGAAARELSVYGEVQAVNADTNSMNVQYYDYDSDEEKTVDMLANKDTKIENAASLANIAKGDWVDVTYAAADGKNVARSIIVEKEEKEAEPAAAGANPEAKPAELPQEE